MEGKSSSSPVSDAPEKTPAKTLVEEQPKTAGNGSEAVSGTSDGLAPSPSPAVGMELVVAPRRRGRPRKMVNGPESPPESKAMVVAQTSESMALAVAPPPGFLAPVEKRGRGRPKGSVNKAKQPIIGSSEDDSSTGENFVPHLVNVQSGEDIATRISLFSQEIGPRSLCVISAIGSVSSSFLAQSDSSIGILRNKEICEIQSISGSYTFSEMRGIYRMHGSLSVALTRPDGEIVGGRVCGPLIASGPVQLMMGSFRQIFGKKPDKKLRYGESSTPENEGKSLSAEP